MIRGLFLFARLFALVALTALPAGCVLLPLGTSAALYSMLLVMGFTTAALALAAPALLILKLVGRLSNLTFLSVSICSGALIGLSLGYMSFDSDPDPAAAVVFNPQLAAIGSFIGAGFAIWSAVLGMLLFKPGKLSEAEVQPNRS